MFTVEQLSGMQMSELLTEEKSRYQQVAEFDKKYPTGLTQIDNAEDHKQYQALLDEVDQLGGYISAKQTAQQQQEHNKKRLDVLSRPAQRHEQPQGDIETRGGAPASFEMFGAEFVESAEYKRIVESGVLHNPSTRVEFGVQLKRSLLPALMRKALAYSGTGVGGNNLIVNDRTNPLDFLWRQTTLLDMIPTAQTTSNMIEYYEMTTSTNNAAFVAEASATTGTTGLKPEGAIGWALRTSPVSTLAEWIPVTNQFLADAPAVEGIIREQLLMHLQLALETGIISGNGTAPNLRGILNTAGIQTLGVTTNVADAALNAMNQIMVTGLSQPNGVVMHPNDWTALRLTRENAATGTLGQYLYGPPSVAGPMTLWGRTVVLSLGIPENTMLVGDFQRGCMLFDREQSAIRVGTINDQFVRNMLTILAELRAAFAVFRAAAFAQITGV
jgi:HK97 family phage major capsid protein